MSSQIDSVKLTRQGKVVRESPAIEDVFALMETVKHDKGAPEFSLEYLSPQGGSTNPLTLLHFVLMKGCDGDASSKWLVRHKDRRQKTSHVLATTEPGDGEFIRCLLCGAFASVRKQCFVDNQLVDSAVSWFLRTGDRNPSLTWLDFLGSVRPE